MMIDGSSDVLGAYIEYEKARRQADCERLRNEVANVPVPAAVLEELCQLNPKDFSSVMRFHPGHDTEEKLKSLWAVLETFRTSCADLNAAIERFASHEPTRAAGGDREHARLVAVLRKEVFAASAGAAALVDHARGVREHIPIPNFELKRRTVFDAGQHEFIIGIRNSLAHSCLVSPEYRISWGADRKKKTSFHFRRSELINNGRFTARARAHIEAGRDDIDVGKLFAEYASRVEAFYGWFGQTIEEHLLAEVADYRRCLQYQHRVVSRMFYRVALNTWISWRVDPYPHLPEYLEPDQLQEVNRLQFRSAEQVHRIIQLADKDEICDEELRSLVFRLFRVAGY